MPRLNVSEKNEQWRDLYTYSRIVQIILQSEKQTQRAAMLS
jgi:hypothetical protein